VDTTYSVENQRERKRLEQMVRQMTDSELTRQLYTEGWTVAVALAHLAFWDQRRLVLLRKWQKEGYKNPDFDDDTTNLINDTLLPFFLALEPRQAANMAVRIAEELDQALEKISPVLRDTLQNSGDQHALNRGIHRKMHLDEIVNLLKSTSGGVTAQ
jgi:hypothetical protein